jgi:hypothetical protein
MSDEQGLLPPWRNDGCNDPAVLSGMPSLRTVQADNAACKVLGLGVALKAARMIPEIPLAILPAALRVASTSRGTFVRVNFKANFCCHRQNQHLACLVAARMADKAVFAGRGGRSPKDRIANLICAALCHRRRLQDLRRKKKMGAPSLL